METKLTKEQITACRQFNSATNHQAQQLGKKLGLTCYITGKNYLTFDTSLNKTNEQNNLAVTAARFVASNFTAVIVHAKQNISFVVAGGKLLRIK